MKSLFHIFRTKSTVSFHRVETRKSLFPKKILIAQPDKKLCIFGKWFVMPVTDRDLGGDDRCNRVILGNAVRQPDRMDSCLFSVKRVCYNKNVAQRTCSDPKQVRKVVCAGFFERN